MTQARVYIMEDDQTMIGLLKTLLCMEGYEVMTLQQQNNSSALEALAESRSDILLLDVHLRDMDGLQLLHQIKSDPVFNSLKVIMTSGSDYRDFCLKAGADGFLLKPYLPEDLLHTLHGLLPALKDD